MTVERIIMFILESENDDDNIMQMIAHYNNLFENFIFRDHRAVHVRNKNYFEVTIPQYSLSDFHAHFRMTPATMEVCTTKINNKYFTNVFFTFTFI